MSQFYDQIKYFNKGFRALADSVIALGKKLTTGLGKYPVVQTTGAVPALSATAVHAAVTLADGATTLVTTAITHPTVYRALSVKGNQAGVAGDVVITGTDWAGRVISDTIALADNGTVEGVKPFATVTSILLPARVAAGDTVSVGICDKLGLYRAIAAAGDVVEVARKASAAAEYTIEATGTVNATYGTVKQGTQVTASDSFEIHYLSSEL